MRRRGKVDPEEERFLSSAPGPHRHEQETESQGETSLSQRIELVRQADLIARARVERRGHSRQRRTGRTISPGWVMPPLGAASAVIPKFVSPSDPAVQWTGALRGQPSLPC